MKIRENFLITIFGLMLLSSPIFADGQLTSDPVAKEEADYQHFIKDHVGYKLLTVEYDKFKKTTKISSDYRMSNEMEFNDPKGGGTHLKLQVVAVVPDNPTKDDFPLVDLAIISNTEQWTYLKCQDFNWLVDGKDFKYEQESYDNTVLDNGGVLEFFYIGLNPRQFNKLVQAKTIECKICNDEFVFNKKQIWVMRWVNEQLQQLVKPKAAKSE